MEDPSSQRFVERRRARGLAPDDPRLIIAGIGAAIQEELRLMPMESRPGELWLDLTRGDALPRDPEGAGAPGDGAAEATD